MRFLLALFAVSLSVISALPVELIPQFEELIAVDEFEKCDPDPCPVDNEDPPSEDSEGDNVLIVDDILEETPLSDLEANETAAEHEHYHKWSGWLNGWDKPVRYGLRWTTVAMNGMYSKHSNSREDRLWQYKSRTYARGMLLAGKKYEWLSKGTAWQKPFTRYSSYAVMVGAISRHSNAKEDRTFRFKFRRINTKTWMRKTWRWTAWSKYDKVQSANCNTGWIMGVRSVYGKKYNDRRFSVLCGWVVRRPKTTPTWVTRTRAVAKSTTVTNSVAVTRKK